MKSLRTAFPTFCAVCLSAALSVASSPPAGAEDTDQDLELFRSELINYVSDLEALPITLVEAFVEDPMALVEARENLQALDDTELAQMRAALEQVPYWQALPGILATSLPTEEYFSPLELAASFDPQRLLMGSVRAQQDLMAFVDQLEDLPGRVPDGALSAGYGLRVAGLRAKLEALSPSDRLVLRQAFNARAPRWRDKIRTAIDTRGAPAAADKDHCGPSTASCGSLSFPNDVLCEIENVIDEIAAIPCKVGEFAVEAGEFILDSLLALLAALLDVLPSVDDLISTFESILPSAFSEPDWPMKIFPGRREALIAKGIDPKAVDPVAAIPCPIAFGANPGDFPNNPLNIPLIGQFGDRAGAVRCDRQFNFVPEAVEEFFPDDVSNATIKVIQLVVQVANSLLDYLCNCYSAAADILLDDRQFFHRDLVAKKFCTDSDDTSNCEGWSLVQNCDSSSGCQDNPNAESERNAYFLKISDLARKGDAAMCAVAGQESTLACVDDLVSNISGDVAILQSDVAGVLVALADLDADVANVDADVQAALGAATDTNADLTIFQELALQLRIEADLVREGDTRISLFQLPQAVGGYIEEVSTIVSEAIEQRGNAGRDVDAAIRFLRLADNLYQEGAFKKAYTQYRNAYRVVVLTR